MTQEQKQKIGEGDYEIMKSYMNNPTPSDTFIDEKMKEFDERFVGNDKEWWKVVMQPLRRFLKSSLQEQRQSILEEIEKALNSTDNILGGDTNKLIHLQCHLKSLLK